MFVLPWMAARGKSASIMAAQIMGASSPPLGQPLSDPCASIGSAIRPVRLVPFPNEDTTSPASALSQTIRNAIHTMPFVLPSDDELIARLLIHTWTLTTGKTLRGDVPPHELSDEELIDFWSDDRLKQTPVSPPSRPRDGGEERAAEDGER